MSPFEINIRRENDRESVSHPVIGDLIHDQKTDWWYVYSKEGYWVQGDTAQDALLLSIDTIYNNNT